MVSFSRRLFRSGNFHTSSSVFKMSRFSKGPPEDADKLPAVLAAIADAHGALSAAYGKLSDPAMLDSLDAFGLERGVTSAVEEMAGAHASASKEAALAIRAMQKGQIGAIRAAVKAQRDRTESSKLAMIKATEAAKKKPDAKAVEAEKAAREQYEQAEAELSAIDAKARLYVAALTQDTLRGLAHIESSVHAVCLEKSSAALRAIPMPRITD